MAAAPDPVGPARDKAEREQAAKPQAVEAQQATADRAPPQPQHGDRAAPFRLERLGVVMQADPTVAEEVEGVLNPAAARGPDGELYLFPRLVGRGNRSRVGRATVRFDRAGTPVAVERLGPVLEPQEPYELRPAERTGGCEDPRVTYVEPLRQYVLAYTAWGPSGPRVALAVSHDLAAWRRLGLAEFIPDPDPVYGVDFDTYHNKDAMFFPRAVTAPNGESSLAILHRPVYDVHVPEGIGDPRPTIWISYCPLVAVQRDLRALTELRQHQQLLAPEQPWEELRLGAGTPPLLTPLGWLVVYHGVAARPAAAAADRPPLSYCAGALVLGEQDPRQVKYRSATPVLRPETGAETEGVVPHVVFPTGVDDRHDGRIDVYYGMADLRIGVARLQLPATLPAPPPP